MNASPIGLALLSLFCVAPGLLVGQDVEAAGAKMSRRAVADEVAKMGLEVKRDRFTGGTTVSVTGMDPILATSTISAADIIIFAPGYAVLANGVSSYAVTVTATLPEWYFLRGTIEFLVDGKPAGETEAGTPRRDVLAPNRLFEQFTTLVSSTLFEKLSHASRIEIRLPGERESPTFTLEPRFVAMFWKLREAPQALKKSEPHG